MSDTESLSSRLIRSGPNAGRVRAPAPMSDTVPQASALKLAILFHETYERLAPSFGYETRADTKTFDPESKNGRLMVAVCGEIASQAPAAIAEPAMTRAQAVSLARSAAVARPDGHKYIPSGKLPDDWQPHEWVIDAILAANRCAAPIASQASPAAVEALRKLTFAARTSGGTAGPDAALMAACDAAEAALADPEQAQTKGTT